MWRIKFIKKMFNEPRGRAAALTARLAGLQPLPASSVGACVVLPARDEASGIITALTALNRQFTVSGTRLPPQLYEIIVLANNCRDETAEQACRFRESHTDGPVIHVVEAEIPAESANIGFVRRVLLEAAAQRFYNAGKPSGVILSTDGDTCVAPDWVAQNLHAVEKGAEAVGGRIEIARQDLAGMDDHTRSFQLYDTAYRLRAAELEGRLDPLIHDPNPRHHQHFNASFAITAAALRRAGGVPEVEFLEDVALYEKLLQQDARFRHSPQVRVTTSGRSAGRTALGLSTQLNEWRLIGEAGDDYLVAGLPELAARFTGQAQIRRYHHIRRTQAIIRQVADTLAVAPAWLEEQWRTAATAGALLAAISAEQHANGAWRQRFPLVGVRQALADVCAYLHCNRATANFRQKLQAGSGASVG